MRLLTLFLFLGLTSFAFAADSLATFAGGCFWCMQPPFRNLPGVKSVVSGYTGGKSKNPTYREVSTGKTGHVESVQITYDPAKLKYEQLLDVFWRSVDPTDDKGQFVDKGDQYQSIIFFHTPEQKKLAEKSKADLQKSGRFATAIVTKVLPAVAFWPAEEYHQDYDKKNPDSYNSYHSNSGRDKFLDSVWGKNKK